MHNNIQPLVSVVIPCYNHEQYVRESIQSIIDQDYNNIELIIIDDGSKDNSVEIISKMIPSCEQRFVRFEFRSRPNKGLCATLNEALEWCKGDYFSPIASDDIALPHKISFLVYKIINTDYSAVFGSIKLVGNSNLILRGNDKTNYSFSELFLEGNPLAAPAALMKTLDIKKVGGYQEDLALEDWSMWLKLTSEGKKLASYNEVVTLYRQHDNNTVNDEQFMYEAKRKVIDLYKEHPLYNTAIRKQLYLEARRIAEYKTIKPIILLMKSGYFNQEGCIVLIKVIIPKKLIKLKRKLINKVEH